MAGPALRHLKQAQVKLLDIYILHSFYNFNHGPLKMENDEYTEPDGTTDSPSHAIPSHFPQNDYQTDGTNGFTLWHSIKCITDDHAQKDAVYGPMGRRPLYHPEFHWIPPLHSVCHHVTRGLGGILPLGQLLDDPLYEMVPDL